MFQHPNYDSGPGFTQNDISVVQAQSTISGTNISPGTMAASTANPGGNGMITGWGRTCGECHQLIHFFEFDFKHIYPKHFSTRFTFIFNLQNKIQSCFYNKFYNILILSIFYCLGSCNIPVALQGTSIPIISDASCTSIWGSSFQASAMICVWGGTGGTIGSCNVSHKSQFLSLIPA